MKSAPLSKGALLLVMFERRFYTTLLRSVSIKLWTVENHCSLSSLYSAWNKRHIKLYLYIVCSHLAVFIKTFHFALILILEIWFIALMLEAIQISGSTGFMRNSLKNAWSKQAFSKWMHFQNVLPLWEL